MNSGVAYKVVSNIPQDLSSETKKIGTHSGSFHCDESLAIGLLSLLKEYQDGIVIRTRDETILSQCDIIVDVGAIYDAQKHRYDHHQASFKDTFDNDKFNKIRLSSAGLIYKHFGRQIIEELVGEKATIDQKDDIYLRMYANFIEHIDANDNGIEVSDGELKYKITTTLPNRVSRFNPKWNQPSTDESLNLGFSKAIELTRSEFLESLSFYVDDWLPAYQIVERAFNSRFQVDSSGEIVLFDQFCPWKAHLYVLEEKTNSIGSIKFALFQDVKGDWRVQAVPQSESSFTSRVPLHKDWRGIRDEELSQKSGIPGCIFVHASGFIGGAKSYESALQLAKLSLESSVEEPELKKSKQE
ncbi:metal binding protein [Naegleria gruberi]|uniref:Metal binding protein n=1 Tax=Naegleria gruberi TaxID=5762 RepID=D2VQR4_NAEGR|nr:metal binding protein [Naegleria gruberi]EFC40750.1 metal binding protein [Naegleria gruberi]|eukprot:XP_002673494.1 metal binding protein [Naegleria gruberi strain NEG-M]